MSLFYKKKTIGSPFDTSGIPAQYPKAHQIMEENQIHFPNTYSKKKGHSKKGHIKTNSEQGSPTTVFVNNIVQNALKKNEEKQRYPTPLVLNPMIKGGKSRKRRNKRSIKSKPNKRKTFRKKRVHLK